VRGETVNGEVFFVTVPTTAHGVLPSPAQAHHPNTFWLPDVLIHFYLCSVWLSGLLVLSQMRVLVLRLSSK